MWSNRLSTLIAPLHVLSAAVYNRTFAALSLTGGKSGILGKTTPGVE
jgi:hypothetical protein